MNHLAWNYQRRYQGSLLGIDLRIECYFWQSLLERYLPKVPADGTEPLTVQLNDRKHELNLPLAS